MDNFKGQNYVLDLNKVHTRINHDKNKYTFSLYTSLYFNSINNL